MDIQRLYEIYETHQSKSILFDFDRFPILLYCLIRNHLGVPCVYSGNCLILLNLLGYCAGVEETFRSTITAWSAPSTGK